MRTIFFAFFATALMLSAAASAQEEPAPPGPCVTAVYRSMSSTWGPDDANFNPYYTPVDAWQVFRHDDATTIQIVAGAVNMWLLTEHGADFVRQTGRNQYEGVYIATRLLSCRESLDGAPAVIETMISTAAPQRTTLRERIEIVPHSTMIITRFDPETGAVVSEQRMRAYMPAPAPSPAPPRRR